MRKYTIICTELYYGQITYPIEENQVRKECERLRNVAQNANEKTYWQIEVINNETGEVREYWNNKKNEIEF